VLSSHVTQYPRAPSTSPRSCMHCHCHYRRQALPNNTSLSHSLESPHKWGGGGVQSLFGPRYGASALTSLRASSPANDWRVPIGETFCTPFSRFPLSRFPLSSLLLSLLAAYHSLVLTDFQRSEVSKLTFKSRELLRQRRSRKDGVHSAVMGAAAAI